jgi:hypothetical protein
MVWYRDVIFRLRDIGLLDVILPFMLVFVVIFAILQKTPILGTGDEAKKYNLIVALVIGLLVVVPHVIYGGAAGDGELTLTTKGGRHYPDVVDIMNNSLPTIAIWIIAILAVMLLVGMFDQKLRVSEFKTWIFWGAIIIVFYVFAVSANWFSAPGWLDWLHDRTNQAILLILLVFGLVIFYITKKEPTEEERERARREGFLEPVSRRGGGGEGG